MTQTEEKNKFKLGLRGIFFIGHTVLIVLAALLANSKDPVKIFPLFLLIDFPWAYPLLMTLVDLFRITNLRVLFPVFGLLGGGYWFLIGWGMEALIKHRKPRAPQKADSLSAARLRPKKLRDLLDPRWILSFRSFRAGVLPLLSLILLDRGSRMVFPEAKRSFLIGCVLFLLCFIAFDLCTRLLQGVSSKWQEPVEVKDFFVLSGIKIFAGTLFAFLPFMLGVLVFFLSFSITRAVLKYPSLDLAEFIPIWASVIFVNGYFCFACGASVCYLYAQKPETGKPLKGSAPK